MDLTQGRTYTIEDIYALPDGQRAELIDGQMYMMAPPNTIHQNLVSEFTIAIGNSPSDPHRDYDIKLFKYRSAGLREYWIVNPKTHTVNVFDFEHKKSPINTVLKMIYQRAFMTI